MITGGPVGCESSLPFTLTEVPIFSLYLVPSAACQYHSKAKGTASRLTAEAQGYRLKVENEAKGNASRFEQILTQYNRAPEVMRDRLYIEAQEQILSNVSKVFIDQKNSNNLLYLPLDKLIQQATPETTSPRVDVIPQVDMNQSSMQNLERTRDAFKSRDREVR